MISIFFPKNSPTFVSSSYEKYTICSTKTNKGSTITRKTFDIYLFKLRAEDGTQTRDPQLGRLMLYQLSYFRNLVPKLDRIVLRLSIFKLGKWAVMDSNHRRRKPADLQSAPFGHSGNCPLVKNAMQRYALFFFCANSARKIDHFYCSHCRFISFIPVSSTGTIFGLLYVFRRQHPEDEGNSKL